MNIIKTTFTIANSSTNEMCIIHELEGFEFLLPQNEEISIEFDATVNSIILRYSIEDGLGTVGILPENSNYKVFYKGIDVFQKYL